MRRLHFMFTLFLIGLASISSLSLLQRTKAQPEKAQVLDDPAVIPAKETKAEVTSQALPSQTKVSLTETIKHLGPHIENYQALSHQLNETLLSLKTTEEAEAFAHALDTLLKDPENPVPGTLLGAYHLLSQSFPSLKERYQKHLDAWPQDGLLRWLVER